LTTRSNVLYYGDNLEVLRKYVRDETVDLIYLDPPFNSKADYNILFKESTGEQSTAQIQAFSDFWHWDSASRDAYGYLTSNEVDNRVANVAEALHRILGKNDMSAYLFMMTTRLLELHRVLKSSGSLFLHCDPTASHYLKLALDAVFLPNNFRNEIVWRRSHPKGHAFTRFANDHDCILVYAKDARNVKWKMSYKKYDANAPPPPQYTHRDPDGRWYTLDNLLNPNPNRPNLTYEFKGITRVWRWTKARMLEEDKKGRIVMPEGGKVPRYKRYLDEQEGIPIDDFWDDIDYVKGDERLGYPTQKPLALLERIIEAATEEGDQILDPFCGCGTAIVAAEKLERNWIGIDITYLAINLVKNRLKDSFPQARFLVEGEPRDLGAARELSKNRYQFQWWALSLVGARPVGSTPSQPTVGKKGRDEGIDGWLRFAGMGEGQIERIVAQVKSGHVGVKDIRELRDVVTRQKAAIGLFITLEEPTSEMTKEAKATDPYVAKRWNREYARIQILTIEELLKGKKPDLPPTVSPFQEASRIENTNRRSEKTSRLLIQHTLPR
jgi:site-specific DNA-methyltransferase (adenine-specific)